MPGLESLTSEPQVPKSHAKARILKRIDRLSPGLEGDWKSVGEGVRELRIPEGKGYRIYYAWEGHRLIILLCGGMTELARRTGLTRETIYKALGANGNRRFSSLLAIVHAFGLELGVRKQKAA